MRFSTLATATLLTCGLALAADGPQAVTYISGNLDNLTANSGATLDVSGSKAIQLNTGSAKIDVPYASITRAELGEITEFSSEEPLYKVWALHKRFLGKRAVQRVTLDFQTTAGESKTLTLEAPRQVAEDVIAVIEDRTTPETAKTWWGDNVWKTKRNQEQWGGAGTVATREE
jgi:hypothetical protein